MPYISTWRSFGLSLVLGFFGILLSINSSFGVETGIVIETEFSRFPSFSTGDNTASIFRLHLACSDLFTGRLLDCPFTYRVLGLKPPLDLSDHNGGHQHFDTRPLIEPANGALGYEGMDRDPDPLGIDGQTGNARVLVEYLMPQAAGKIVIEDVFYSPPGYRCGFSCFTLDSNKFINIMDVGINGLIRLPDSGDHHVVVRLGTGTHPEGTYGTKATIDTLKKIAKKYFKDTGRKLSINDISLPKGGLFDIKNNWATPHIEHRTGADADINRTDGGGVRTTCETDEALKKAIAAVATEQPRPS